MKQILIMLFLIISNPSKFQLLGDCSTISQVINYYEAVQYMPDMMIDRLSYYDWKLNYIDNIDETYPHAIGYYDTSLKEVYVDDKKIHKKCSEVDLTIQETIVHEFIHAYDYQQDYMSCMIYNPKGVDSDEVFAYSLTDWLFGRSVCKEHEEFFKCIFK